MVIIKDTFSAYCNNGDDRHIRNTPAVTMVAAWIKADTGVGPSIASGNQVCNPTWADLPTAPIKRKKPIKSNKLNEVEKNNILLSANSGANAKITP